MSTALVWGPSLKPCLGPKEVGLCPRLQVGSQAERTVACLRSRQSQAQGSCPARI